MDFKWNEWELGTWYEDKSYMLEQVNLDSKHCFRICISDNNISFSL